MVWVELPADFEFECDDVGVGCILDCSVRTTWTTRGASADRTSTGGAAVDRRTSRRSTHRQDHLQEIDFILTRTRIRITIRLKSHPQCRPGHRPQANHHNVDHQERKKTKKT
ncbi:uncharacterized protein LOC106014188 [Aplysia californica]|uniref:Uncharacterized protein LOC106014188 n=1 Tax=Aplysia californica TaxID=6500 RepID=A0ABM1AFS0_APLCA|nr:uncharacterized protein LOC106014188 [Aplysia californica]